MNTFEHINLRRACNAWNWHTNPAALRTDWEADCHLRAARKIREFIRRNYAPSQIRERSNGSLRPADEVLAS